MRGLIFDLDDTLYPYVQFVAGGFAAVAAHLEARFGVPAADARQTLECARRTGAHGRELQALCSAYGLPPSIIPELVGVFRSHPPKLTLAKGAGTMLRRVRAAGWRTAILTNGLPRVQEAKVRALRLDTLVDHVVFAEEHAPGGKPAAAPFLEALRRLGLPSRRCVFVGDDTFCDIAGARSVGMATILVSSTARPVCPAIPDAATTTLEAVPELAAAVLEGVTRDVA